MPVPPRFTVAVGRFKALLSTVSVALLAPVDAGLKEIVLFSVEPAGT